VPWRFLPILVAVSALALLCAGQAVAASLTFDGRVLRYRAEPRVAASVWVFPEVVSTPTYLEASVRRPVDVGFGCHEPFAHPDRLKVVCPLRVPFEQVRYRFVLSNRSDRAAGSGIGVRGVVYAGNGRDRVSDADRVFGGRADDSLDGVRLYGGPGDDNLSAILDTEFPFGDARAPGPNFLFGGPGKDTLRAPGWLYGGPGDDHLSDTFVDDSRDMMVGGPGRDVVFPVIDRFSDVVRVRGGGADHVICAPGGKDVLFVDRSDRLDPDCHSARVLLTERPRYPYP
jgi:hypothetical protein